MLADMDRPLNKRGNRDAPFMAQKMKELGIEPDYIITSIARRARETAEYFAKEFDIKPENFVIETRLYLAGPSDVIEVVQKTPADKQSVFVFGHNPTFTELANHFAGLKIDNVPTCGIFQAKAMMDDWSKFKPEHTAFVAFYYPKQYMK